MQTHRRGVPPGAGAVAESSLAGGLWRLCCRPSGIGEEVQTTLNHSNSSYNIPSILKYIDEIRAILSYD